MPETTTHPSSTTASAAQPVIAPAVRASGAAQVGLAASILLFAVGFLGPAVASCAGAAVIVLAFGVSGALRHFGTFESSAFATATWCAIGAVSTSLLYLYARRLTPGPPDAPSNKAGAVSPRPGWTPRHPWMVTVGLALAVAIAALKLTPEDGGPGVRTVFDALLLCGAVALTSAIVFFTVRLVLKILFSAFRLGRSSSYKCGLVTGVLALAGGLGVLAAKWPEPDDEPLERPRWVSPILRVNHGLMEPGSLPDRGRRALHRLSLMLPGTEPITPVPQAGRRIARSVYLPASIGDGANAPSTFEPDGWPDDGGDQSTIDQCMKELFADRDTVVRSVHGRFKRQLDVFDVEDVFSDALLDVCQEHAGAQYRSRLEVLKTACVRAAIDQLRGVGVRIRRACEVAAFESSCRAAPSSTAEERLDTERQFGRSVWCRLGDQEREVLSARLIDRMRYRDIAEEMGISERRARDIGGNALKKLELWASRECSQPEW